jgi:hypothetical protein
MKIVAVLGAVIIIYASLFIDTHPGGPEEPYDLKLLDQQALLMIIGCLVSIIGFIGSLPAATRPADPKEGRDFDE